MPKLTMTLPDGHHVTITGPHPAEVAKRLLTVREETEPTSQMARDIRRLVDDMKREGLGRLSPAVSHWPPTPWPHRDGLIS